MIAVIARHEVQKCRRDRRLLAAVAIVLALLAASVASGWHYQRQLAAERASAQHVEQERWRTQGQKNAHSAAHYGVYAFKPASPVAGFDRGIEPFVGVSVWLEAHHMNHMAYRPAQDGTALTRFGELTASLVLQVLLPLLIVLLAFDVFAGDRERGVLRQIVATGVPYRDLLLGKAAGVGLVAGAVLIPAAVLGALAVTLHSGGEAASVGQVGVLSLVYLIYLAGWLLLALAVSAWSGTGRAALVTLLAVWVSLCVVAPRIASDLAGRLVPTPSAAEFVQALEAETGPAHSSDRALARRARILKEHNVTRIEDLPFDWRGINLQEEEERNYPIFDRHFGALFDRYRGQDRWVQAFGALSPQLAAQALSQAIAGTDFENHRQFIVQAEAQRRVMQKLLNEHVTKYDREGADSLADTHLWESIPPFKFVRPALSDTLAHYRIAGAALAIWLLTTSALSYTAVRRLRP